MTILLAAQSLITAPRPETNDPKEKEILLREGFLSKNPIYTLAKSICNLGKTVYSKSKDAACSTKGKLVITTISTAVVCSKKAVIAAVAANAFHFIGSFFDYIAGTEQNNNDCDYAYLDY